MVQSEAADLSIIILNYNVKDLLLKCLESIFKSKGKVDKWQVIVVDNNSSDGSVEAVKEIYLVIRKEARMTESRDPSLIAQDDRKKIQNDKVVELVENKENLGFAVGNNVGVKKAKAPVILFLNPDTVIVDQAIQKSYQYLMSNPDIGALTCRVELPDGRLDYSCHRGFPTPWNSFCYFTGLSKLFPHSPIFAGYTATYLNINTPHEIDCLTGAFMMVRKIAGEQIKWWDTDYFFNGEDVEFCYQLKQRGWQIWFYPEVKIIHYKGSSSGLWSYSQVKVDKNHRIKIAKHGVSSMRIFYMKHYYKKYSPLFRDLVLAGIKMLEHYRKFKIWIYQ